MPYANNKDADHPAHPTDIAVLAFYKVHTKGTTRQSGEIANGFRNAKHFLLIDSDSGIDNAPIMFCTTWDMAGT